jgi:hypothetical protein
MNFCAGFSLCAGRFYEFMNVSETDRYHSQRPTLPRATYQALMAPRSRAW